MGNSRKVLRVLAFLVICIPLYLAIYNWHMITSPTPTVEAVTRITVSGANGAPFEYSSSGDIRTFIRAVEEANLLRQPPRDVDSPQILTFYMGSQTIVYELFLNLDPNLCVLRDSDGDWFHIRTDDARALLRKQISHGLFEHNRLPAAYVSQGDGIASVLPEEGGIWRLRKIDGDFHDTSVSGLTAGAAGINEVRISVNQPFDINFAIEPDIITVEVLNNRVQEFDGLLHQLPQFNFEGRTELQFILTAEWREHDDREFYGTAVYHINVIYEVPAVFAISANQAEQGDLLVITAFNVGERETLTLSVPELEYTADFVQAGSNRIALVPIGTDYSGVLNIGIGGDYSESYQITVSARAAASRNISSADEHIAAHLSANARHQREVAYGEIFAAPSSAQALWEGEFIRPGASDNILLAFGVNVTVNMGNAFINQGVNFSANAGEPVAASNAGRVVAIGPLPKVGNLIVIDHGAGLRTWYGRLDTISVQEGDMVEKGQQIGTFGRSGLPTTLGHNLYFAVSVHDIFIDPVNLLRNGIQPADRFTELPEIAGLEED